MPRRVILYLLFLCVAIQFIYLISTADKIIVLKLEKL